MISDVGLVLRRRKGLEEAVLYSWWIVRQIYRFRGVEREKKEGSASDPG